MANQVVLDAGRVVTAAIMLTENNGLKFDHFGATLAALSPALSEIRSAVDPVRALRDGRYRTAYSGNSIFPIVEVKYKPAKDVTGIRTARATQTAGTAPTAGQSLTVTYNQHIEKDYQFPILSAITKEPATQEYVRQVLAGNFETRGLPSNIQARDMLTDMGLEMLRELNRLIPTINNNTLTTLLSGVGKNAEFPTASAPSAAAPFPKINLWGTADKRWDTGEFRKALRMTQLKNNIEGRPLVVGGSLLAEYLDWAKIQTINAEGLSQSALMRDLEFDFYYDKAADTIFGANKIVMFDTGAFCMNTFPEHDPVFGIINGNTQVDNVFYGQMDITIPQFQSPVLSGAVNNISEVTMSWDVRVKKALDAQDLPLTTVTPSLKYGYYKRPVGYYTSVTTDIQRDVTGIFGFELQAFEPVTP